MKHTFYINDLGVKLLVTTKPYVSIVISHPDKVVDIILSREEAHAIAEVLTQC